MTSGTVLVLWTKLRGATGRRIGCRSLRSDAHLRKLSQIPDTGVYEGSVCAIKTLRSRDAAVERPWMGLPRVLNVTTGPRLKGLKFCVLR